jgi:glycerate kinase
VRVIFCPDSFTGTLSAAEAADAMARGWLRTRPDDSVVTLPQSDGGPGFVSALHGALGGELRTELVSDPLGRTIDAQWLFVGDSAYIESASACGLHLLAGDERNPALTSTFGVGQLVAAAIAAGARRVVVGLGGTATNDAGAGLLAALGATARDSRGDDVTYLLASGGLGLRDIASVDISVVSDLLRGVTIEVATDVDNPLLGLRGATNTFGPQKGASNEVVMQLEGSLQHFSDVIGRRADGKSAAVALGAGAAGGLGFALMHVGAIRTAGIDRIMEFSGLNSAVKSADLVVTGEGSFDWQSLSGKVVTGVARAALELGVTVVVVAGQVDLGRREWQSIGVHGVYSLVEMVGETEAFSNASLALSDALARVARTWGR